MTNNFSKEILNLDIVMEKEEGITENDLFKMPEIFRNNIGVTPININENAITMRKVSIEDVRD